MQSPWHTDHIEVVNNALIPEGAYYTQLRGQCNSDAAYKIAGGAMLSRLTSNWPPSSPAPDATPTTP